ncbi:unnamed protein product [Effrenium voratum]|nr:unnamed protein product [Effrenium voratum]
MASSLESEAAFVDRASKIGVEEWIVDRLKAMQLATFGNFAFAVAYSPQSANDTMFKEFVADLLQAEPDASQLATLRRLFFECHTRALVDVRSRVESNTDPSATQRHLPTAERAAQEAKLGGLIFTPDMIPSHHLVDMFVEMCETGILVYVKPELCCSRAQETQTMKRDSAISTDASGLLKISPKAKDPRKPRIRPCLPNELLLAWWLTLLPLAVTNEALEANWAKTSVHPMDAADHVEAVTNEALEANWNFHPDLIRLERKKSLLQAKLMAKKLEEQEEGVPLVGCHDSPDCYPLKLKPASLTEEDLAQSAVWRRKAMLNRRSAELDPSHVDHLEETAGEELQAGFLEGPFKSEHAVTEFFGHDRWSVVRRFVLVQTSEMKLRPIDDCLESQLNAAFTATSYLKLQDVDYAYKQMGIAPEHRYLAVIFFKGKQGVPRFYACADGAKRQAL